MAPLRARRRRALPALVLAAALGSGCASHVPGPGLAEVGNSLERLRTGIVTHSDPTRAYGTRSLALRAQFAELRGAIARLPDVLRLRQSFLPDQDDLDRLVAPPSSAWRPAGLGERLAGRLRL